MALANKPIEASLARGGMVLLHEPTIQTASSSGTEISVANENVWVTAVASTSAAVQFISLTLQERTGSNSMVTGVFDIGVGAASSEVVIAESLWVQKTENAGGASSFADYRLPLNIPSGSRVAVRYNTLHGTRGQPINYYMKLYGGAANLTSYNKCDLIGRGTTVDTTANTYSAWVQLNASTAYNYKEIIVGHISPFDGALSETQQRTDIGVGAASSEVIVASGMTTATNDNDDMVIPSVSPRMAVEIASGSRVVGRQYNQVSGANSVMQISAWGFRL